MTTPGFSVLLNSFIIWLIVINPLSKYPLMLTPINISIETVLFKVVRIRSKFSRNFYSIISRTMLSFLFVYILIIFSKFYFLKLNLNFFLKFFVFFYILKKKKKNSKFFFYFYYTLF